VLLCLTRVMDFPLCLNSGRSSSACVLAASFSDDAFDLAFCDKNALSNTNGA